MRIRNINSQHRRDFTADYECDHCGNVETGPGYDDEYFHTIVVPGMVCSECGEKAGADYQPQAPKYPAGYQV